MINKKKALRISFLTMMIFFVLLLNGNLVDIPFGTSGRGISYAKYGGIILFIGIFSGVLIKKYYPETSERK